ncbi:hypothetical protein RBB78_12610 [Tunturiibacter empetritectus]|uniref:hypothetical protein n=1 Tax=Tunturiibacter empetritectus TaxID=3069691 RepID=UPI003D9BB24B
MSSVVVAVGAAMGVALLRAARRLWASLAAAEEKGRHEEDAAEEAPEEDALVAGDHRAAPSWFRRQLVRPVMMASAICCW